MQNFSMQSPSLKRALALRALLFEVAVIIVLVLATLFLLAYFKVIDISTIIPFQNNQQNVIQQKAITDTQSSVVSQKEPPPLSSDLVQRVHEVATNSAVTKYDAHIVYKGRVTSVLRNGFEETFKINYVIALDIKGEGAVASQIFLTKSDLGHLTLAKGENGKESPMSISEIRGGDVINLDYYMDYMRPNYDNLTSGTLVKIVSD